MTIPKLRLKPDVKNQWLAALRSGEYEQGKGVLRRVGTSGNKEYCCLGVLCELAVRSGVGQWEDDDDAPHPHASKMLDTTEPAGEEPATAVLTRQVVNWAFEGTLNSNEEFWAKNPTIREPRGRLVSASSANDCGQYDFNDIADMIEGSL